VGRQIDTLEFVLRRGGGIYPSMGGVHPGPIDSGMHSHSPLLVFGAVAPLKIGEQPP